MTAHELARELLAGADLPVHFSYNYGDHWRTVVAPEVDGVEVGWVKHSSYHDMPRVVEDDDDEERDEDDGRTQVLILS